MQGINGISQGLVQYYQTPAFGNRIVAQEFGTSAPTGNYQARKISLSEGIGLYAKGVYNQAKEIVTSVVQHPIRTLGVVGATSVGLLALPLIGIPTAVGGAALAVGFAGFAAANGAKHAIQFAKNNAIGDYDKARDNLEQLGGDSLDLAMSAPFVPKALKEIKHFSKYGQIGYNAEMASKVMNAKGLKGKLSALNDANKEAQRFVNFNEATEAELAKLNGITDAQKADIKAYIRDYNVPKDRIPEVVLEQWAKNSGVSAKPTLRYQSMKETTLGYASGSKCEITLNDFGDNIVKVNTNCNTERYKQVGRALKNFSGTKYKIKYKDVKTGEIFDEIIDAKLVDTNDNFIRQSRNCSPEARRILTTTHEREHIDQFARQYKNGYFTRVTPEAEQIYKQMAAEIKPMTTQEADIYRKMSSYSPKRKTVLAYVADPAEIGARQKEIKLLAKPEFQTLDKVFKTSNNMKISDINKADIAINALRAQSAAV